MCPDLSTAFVASLDRLARELTTRQLNWCLFCGAALALHGLGSGAAGDIDVLTDHAGAQRLLADFALANQADTDSGRFRSAYLLRPDWGPLPIEIMAGFHIRQPGGWQPVALPAAQQIMIGDVALRVATRPALAALFRRCARPKDLARAALLD